jgi:hypothetical protein
MITSSERIVMAHMESITLRVTGTTILLQINRKMKLTIPPIAK